MTNADIINGFVNGMGDSKANSLSINSGRLFSYDTVIGYRTGNGFVAINAWHGTTTSKHLHALYKALSANGFRIVSSERSTTKSRYDNDVPAIFYTYAKV